MTGGGSSSPELLSVAVGLPFMAAVLAAVSATEAERGAAGRLNTVESRVMRKQGKRHCQQVLQPRY